ncbi:hypothetical protein CUC43_25810 [Bacillus thuringiensis LM1212]|uniref:hypothetical protein n=1 Tax=Bacillus cereus group TaxID=86661 RepID=UPI00040C0337|nr:MULTISPECIES: hypothetical protein [Bacillus cereus group]AXY09954.1 hypothetical protein CUC43_25810 [Bacillus thuringiensis LM1212]QDF22855.1 hypothetical protein FJR70_07380 [Bacillus tropicus]QUG96177.1 hypothetical protein HCM98_15070 [Bacillus tropicus]
MTKETKIKELKINGEKVLCQSPVLHEPSASIVIPKRSVYQRQDNTWYIDFLTYARKDFFDFLDKRVDVSVEITDVNGNTRQGFALFTSIDSNSDEPLEYRMEGITELEPVKTQPIPEVPTFHMKDLHGKQVTLYYSSATSTTGDYTVETLTALENAGDSKVGMYVLSCNVKEGHK